MLSYAPVAMIIRRSSIRLTLFAALLGVAPLAGQGAAAQPSPADVAFMSGMIGHHAQAVLMAGWAETHGASPTVLNYCRKVAVSQRDEIHLMERWLADHHQAPADTSGMYALPGPGMDRMRMPGMLTAEQLVRLDSARGPAWDRLFLEDMIRHHQGAVSMVNQLFETPGAGQGLVFQFATDVSADQTIEISRMRQMLLTLP